MSGESSNMYWTVRSKYYVTSTIIPASFPTPPSTPSELYIAPQSEQVSRGWYVRDATPKWAHRDPRIKRHYKYQSPIQHPPAGYSNAESYGYFTAPPSDFPESNLVNAAKRPLEEIAIQNTHPSKMKKNCHDEIQAQKPVKESYDLSALGNSTTNVTDLLAKLVSNGLIQDLKKETSIKSQKEKVQPKKEGDLVHEVDLLNPESLRTKQPGLIDRLYGGMQCSNCSTRFPPSASKQYSEHLDWHFRQNRRARVARRRGESRSWYHCKSDWFQYEEIENSEQIQENWFEAMAKQNHRTAIPEDSPSVVAGKVTSGTCGICGDKFDIFYNDDDDEWHLRNAVCHDNINYHPTCLEHTKDKIEPKSEVVDESTGNNKKAVEILDDAMMEDDDVVYIEEPVEVIVIGDEDDEVEAERKHDYSLVKVKQERIDPVDIFNTGCI